MRSHGAFFSAAFLTDASVYLLFAALPFRAIELGAGPIALGAIPGLYAATYMISAANAGRLSDRVPRLALARAAAIGLALGALALAAAPSLPWLLFALPWLGASLGFFWSPLQAALSDRSRDLSRSLGMFNLSWTLGKGLGLILGGLVTAAMSPRVVLLSGIVPALIVAVILPRRADAGVAVAHAIEPPELVSEKFLRLAWLANALAYGFVGTVNVHAPRFLLAQGAGPSFFGLLLGSVFGIQALTFVALKGKRLSASSLSFALFAGVLAGAMLLGLRSWPRLAAAIPFGLMTGVAYHASLHASLSRAHGRGRAAGMHETVLGAGNTTVPLLGGVVAAASGRLDAPLYLAGGVLMLGGVAMSLAAAARPARVPSSPSS